MEKILKTVTEEKNDTENNDTKEDKNVKKKDTENKGGEEIKPVATIAQGKNRKYIF